MTTHPHLEGLINSWYARGDEWARIMAGFGDDDEIPRLIKLQIDTLDRCRHELEAALAALPGGGVALSEAQCDAIYDALDSWASDLDAYELGLPSYAGGGKEAGRDVIREALTPTPNPHEADRNG